MCKVLFFDLTSFKLVDMSDMFLDLHETRDDQITSLENVCMFLNFLYKLLRPM